MNNNLNQNGFNNVINNHNVNLNKFNDGNNNGSFVTISEIEELRSKACSNFFLLLIIFEVIAIGLFVFIFNEINFAMFIIPVALAFILNGKNKKAFDDAYKKYFVLTTFNCIFQNVNFNLDYGISSDVIASTRMMRMGDRFSSNDYVNGMYKGVKFEFSDIHIEDERRDSDGDKHYVTLFKGQWFIFDFNKNFKSNLQVCEKSFRNAKRKNSLFNLESNYKKIHLEDIEFNKTFNVYAQSDLDAFYVLTPNSMQRIKELNNKVKGSLLFCFVDNRLHVALANNKDSFEVSIFKKINEEKEKSKVYNEVKVIADFIEVLNLDNTLFKN